MLINLPVKRDETDGEDIDELRVKTADRETLLSSHGTVVANVEEVGSPLDDLSLLVLFLHEAGVDPAADLVSGGPDELGVVADLAEVVLLGALGAEGEEFLLLPPGVDCESPGKKIATDRLAGEIGIISKGRKLPRKDSFRKLF